MGRINFEVVAITGTKNVKCVGCGKQLRRQRRFYQTINPFNKKADGTVKDRNEILRELHESSKKWREEPETCGRCLVSQATGKICE